MSEERWFTDALGIDLSVSISIGDYQNAGQHLTHADPETGKVTAGSTHYLRFQRGLSESDLSVIAAHEVYHLFYSIRHLITVDEETEAEAFGHLVGRVHAQYADVKSKGHA